MKSWRVNSYGYPNPFGNTVRAKRAWEILLSFEDGASYRELKTRWDSKKFGAIKPHTVESWKAAFEEFGLLHVLSRDDVIRISAGGNQLRSAAESGLCEEFAWIGINLLLRYPLRGEAGRRRPSANRESDLLLYWFLLASLIELGGIWESELFRVLGTALSCVDGVAAVDRINRLRENPSLIGDFDDPTGGSRGGAYNALNQVMVHGSLNHMIFTRTRLPSPYIPESRENKWQLLPEFRDLVLLALGQQPYNSHGGCGIPSTLLQRMPAAPDFDNESEYFEYSGRSVLPLAQAQRFGNRGGRSKIQHGVGVAYFLHVGGRIERTNDLIVTGPVQLLCELAPGARIIASDDLTSTYIISEKQMNPNGFVSVRLRRGRPVIDQLAARKRLLGG